MFYSFKFFYYINVLQIYMWLFDWKIYLDEIYIYIYTYTHTHSVYVEEGVRVALAGGNEYDIK
jgi:hypothetical protein